MASNVWSGRLVLDIPHHLGIGALLPALVVTRDVVFAVGMKGPLRLAWKGKAGQVVLSAVHA